MNKMNAVLSRLYTGVAGGCLLVSLFQASGQAIDNVESVPLKISIVVGIACALLTSQLLVRSIGSLARAPRGFWWLVGFIVIFSVSFVIEAFSVSTSATSVDGGFMKAQRNENLNSPEYSRYQKKLDRLEAKLASDQEQKKALEKERNDMPEDWFKGKAKVEKRIDKLSWSIKADEKKIDQLTAAMGKVDVSISKKSFENFEQMTGISQTKSFILFGLLMSICPISLAFVRGIIESPFSQDTVVKPKRPIEIDADKEAYETGKKSRATTKLKLA